MRHLAILTGLSFAACGAPAQAQSVPAASLIDAAKTAKLSQIDDRRNYCEDDRRVDEWLKEVVGSTSKSVRWHGGRCVLARKENAIDAGTKWCAHAVIAPKGRGRDATIEVYFEKPVRGRPGVPFAFRSLVFTPDGWDYSRNTNGFEFNWRSMTRPDLKPGDSTDCE